MTCLKNFIEQNPIRHYLPEDKWRLKKEELSIKQQNTYLSGLESASTLLQSMIEEIEKYWQDDLASPRLRTAPARTKPTPSLTEIFIIHGRDDGTKETVARFLSKLDLEPIILHEQANRGLTIIDKFEEHAATAGFAIALLIPDDRGALQGKENDWKPRAQ
uniref:Predicted nucleotide-binding protein containing TIR-like domain-containing protein n=1 Tax=Candidatus Kentrum sp. LFY TaxID=2126342 RepID=A0A450UZZ6_9GAMM|nr:MAG: Predicted nucleotide-binding protein containing TIR-like domain-containing protein [Candidatus Kentron sp. LFY]